MKSCESCKHSKRKFHLWRAICYCSLYKVPAKVVCANYKERRNGVQR